MSGSGCCFSHVITTFSVLSENAGAHAFAALPLLFRFVTKDIMPLIIAITLRNAGDAGADPGGGGGAGAGAHPWDGRTRAEGAGNLVVVKGYQRSGTILMVLLNGMFNTIEGSLIWHINILKSCKSSVCVCQKSLIPIPYTPVIIALAALLWQKSWIRAWDDL